MIKKIIIKKCVLHFREPFKIAYEEVTAAPVIIIKITDTAGYLGLGSAAPDTEVTGETVVSVLEILKKRLTKNFFNLPLSELNLYHKKIQKKFSQYPSAQAAVEEAILNLYAQKNKINLTDFFGGYRQSCATSVTVCIMDRARTLRETKKFIKAGFKIIKIKVGLNLEEDLAKIELVAKNIPKNISILLDANQGYKFEEAKKFIKKIKNYKIKLLEQPVSANNLAELQILHRASKIPIIADEAAVTFSDAKKILENDYAAGVNIKLQKCGGPINFLKIFKLAKRLNKIVMIGCMYESNISLTTSAHLALGLKIDYVDLDSGRLDFPDDPALGGVLIKNGRLTVPSPLVARDF